MDKGPYFEKVRAERTFVWKGGSPLLSRLDMELTERCNHNCIHCSINLPANDPRAIQRELPTQQIKEILEEAASLGCLQVRFTGGEPLLRSDFEELYICARKLGLKVLLFTNGTLITAHLADLFARIPPLVKIEITFYGMERTTYGTVTRTAGSFEAAREGLNLLLERKVPFVVKGVLLPPNKAEMRAFETWASTIPWMEGPPSCLVLLDLRCRRDSAAKNQMIQGLRVTPEEGIQVLNRRFDQYTMEMREFCSRFIGPPGDRLFSCGAGMGSGCVDAYGLFQPCLMLRHPDTVYDLKRGSLKEALKTFSPGIRKFKATNPDYLSSCARCFLKGLCEQCPARSWMEHGTLDTPVDYLCQMAHAQAKTLGLLAVGEEAWEVSDWRERIDSVSGKTSFPLRRKIGSLQRET